MERKADLRGPVKTLPTAEDLRRAVSEPPLTLEGLRREAIEIADDPVATIRERLQALIIYEKLSGFDKPERPQQPAAVDPLDSIKG